MSSPESEASPRVATSPELEIEEFDELNLVWRIGFAPDIWAWTPWNYADDEGLFSGRWDDQQGQFRTIYTAASLLGCFLELLAQFRGPGKISTEIHAKDVLVLIPSWAVEFCGSKWRPHRRG